MTGSLYGRMDGDLHKTAREPSLHFLERRMRGDFPEEGNKKASEKGDAFLEAFCLPSYAESHGL
jgi:hypothetical protein